MKIIHNPKDGAPIKDFIFKGDLLETHFPDGYTTPQGVIANGLMQYEDSIADILLETFGFLEEIDAASAQKIIERPQEEFKCDFPGCDFVSAKKIGLLGHQRGHKKDSKTAEKPVIDPSIIPVANTKKVESVFGTDQTEDAKKADIPNGTDKDGVEWYGEGAQVENHSTQQNAFNGVRGKGKAHFVG